MDYTGNVDFETIVIVLREWLKGFSFIAAHVMFRLECFSTVDYSAERSPSFSISIFFCR